MSDDETPRGLFAWFATNHVAANLLMVLLVVGGGALALGAQVNIFPDIDPRTVTVSVVYPGATPVEVEEGICRRVEEELAGIEGIERVRSVSGEGLGTVTAELTDYADKSRVLDEVKSAVDGIESFPPEDAENPRVSDSTVTRAALTIALWGDADERTLRELAYRLRDDLTALEGISIANVAGVRDYEVGIELSEETLRAQGLGFREVAEAVEAYSVNLPGGSIRMDEGEVLLRTDSQAYDAQDFESLVLRSGPDGTLLRLGDVAEVVDGFEDVELRSRFNGRRAAYVDVKSVGTQQVLEVEQKVKEHLASLGLPEGVGATVWSNRADVLRSRIDLLVRNGAMGLILVFFVLVLFLDLRLAFWTTMGIPISFLGSFLLLRLAGGSINMISLFAFILVLGIVVDDAIVVGENIFAKRERGLTGARAAIEGLREVISPVTVGVLTTILAFVPLYFTEGFFGDILWVVPVVVVGVLLMSLVESFLVLPAHLSGGRLHPPRGLLVVVQDLLRNGLHRLVQRVYMPSLRVALRWRYVTVAAAVTVFALVGGLVAGGHLRTTLFPEIDADDVSVRVTLVEGTGVAETQRVLDHLVASAEAVREEIDPELPPGEPSIFRDVAATLGAQPFGSQGGPDAGAGASGSNVAEVVISLSPGEERSVSSERIVGRWRELVGEIPGASDLDFTSTLLGAGDDVSVELAHAEFDRLLRAADTLKSHLAEFEGVTEIADSFEPGKRELEFELTRAGIASGLTTRELARQVRQAYFGEEAQRIQRGRDDLRVMVRYVERERSSLDSLDELRIRLPDGAELPLLTVARIAEGRGYSSIERADRRRIVRVTADVDERVANASVVNEELRSEFLPGLQVDLPGLSFSFEGAEKERRESLSSLVRLLGVAMVAIYALLAGQLKSYTQPLLILSVVPMGIVGAALGHALLGYDLSFFSFFGVVALSGVVINDSLVLLDRVARQREAGASVEEAVAEAGRRRFRAILFTSLTTCVGLAPMVLEESLQAQFLIPMAISLSAGVAFATLITLVLVPALYLVHEDLARLGEAVRRRVHPDEELAAEESAGA